MFELIVSYNLKFSKNDRLDLYNLKKTIYICHRNLRNFSSILFLSIYMLFSMHLIELVKLPLFFSHFMEHKTTSPLMDLSDFFNIHYSDGIVYDDDYEQDMKLPFKSIDSNSFSIAAFCTPLPDYRYLDKTVEPIVADEHIFYDHIYIASYLSSIWRPPKFC